MDKREVDLAAVSDCTALSPDFATCLMAESQPTFALVVGTDLEMAVLDRDNKLGTQADLPNAKRKQAARSGGFPTRWSVVWLFMWLMVAALFGFRATWQGARESSARSPAVGVSDSGAAVQRIETIRAGQRVISDNPEVETTAQTAVDSSTWRKLGLRSATTWDDGTVDVIEVETLQAPSWIETHRAQVGATVPLPLDLLEMGLADDLTAEVISNEPCPVIPSGPGRVVLTTVNHLNGDVWELTIRDIQGQAVTIRPTALHKFYSRDRNQRRIRHPDFEWGSTRMGVNSRLLEWESTLDS